MIGVIGGAMNGEPKRIARKVMVKEQPLTFFARCSNDSIEFIDLKNHAVKCGEIWMASLPEKSGSVQSGHRPVFVISNDKNNLYSPTVNVIPLTTKMNKKNLPCHVEIWDYKKYGLLAPSTLLIEQLSTISKENLIYNMGKIIDVDMLMRICRAMQSQFPIMMHK